VLTADLVNARRRGGELHLVAFDDDAKARAVQLAERLIGAVTGHVGHTQDELEDALAAIDAGPRDYRMKDALAKLLEDRCELAQPGGLDPEEVRRDVFRRASALRAALGPGEKLDRDVALAEVARERDTTADILERALFADLRGAQVVTAFDAIGADALVAAYERGQAQAVLLRAVKITVDMLAASAHATRAFFRRLKFLRLLHVITKTDEGYRVVIDGPFSMFESVTKYGLQLAMVLPALEECEAWRLLAEVRWGKEKRPLQFRLKGGSASRRGAEVPLPEEVKALQRSFASNELGWKASANRKILELPGVGLTVPDLVFERTGDDGKGPRVYLEVMGYWSRAAVWQRVELVQAGLVERVLFAVSSRLRVSEEVLGEDVPSALYVYKGTMSARAIAERLDAMCAG
jgi:predicted nuclease of restriction endonuclease-like RecB superfamily